MDENLLNNQQDMNDLSLLSSLMSYHIKSDQIISSESHLIRSKFQRFFQFLQTDIYNEPMKQALGEEIIHMNDVDHTLMKLSRNATLKFRNYKQFRQQARLASSNEQRPAPSDQWRSSTSSSRTPFYSRHSLRYLLHSTTFRWFISIVICFDAVTYYS